jgi:hypothetical protein
MSQKLKPCYRLDEIIVQISTTFAITKKHLPMRVVELLPHSHCLKIQILRAQTFLGDICEELSSLESVKKDLEAMRCQRKEENNGVARLRGYSVVCCAWIALTTILFDHRGKNILRTFFCPLHNGTCALFKMNDRMKDSSCAEAKGQGSVTFNQLDGQYGIISTRYVSSITVTRVRIFLNQGPE